MKKFLFIFNMIRPFRTLLFAFLLLVIYYFTLFIFNSLKSPEKIAHQVKKDIEYEAYRLMSKQDKVVSIISGNKELSWVELSDHFRYDSDYEVAIYKGDSLIFWNSNLIDFTSLRNKLNNYTLISSNKNWFIANSHHLGEYLILNALKINPIPYVIISDKGHSTDNSFIIELNKKFNSDPIYCELDLSKPIKLETIILISLFLCSYVFLIKGLYDLYINVKRLINNTLLSLILFTGGLIIVRITEYLFYFPSNLKNSIIFQNNDLSMPFFNSTGDLIFSSVILISILLCIYLEYKKYTEYNHERSTKYYFNMLTLIGLVGLTALFSFWVNLTINKLEYNNVIGIKLNSVYGFVALLFLISICTTIFLFLISFGRHLALNKGNFIPLAGILIMMILVGIFALEHNRTSIIIICTFFLLYLLIIRLGIHNKYFNLLKYSMLLITFSVTVSLLINESLIKKKDRNQMMIAGQMMKEKDQGLENSYKTFSDSLKTDTIFKNSILNYSENDPDSISNYVINKYFAEISSRYKIQITVCSESDSITIQPEEIIVNCNEYFQQFIGRSGKLVFENSLFLVQGETESIYYIGIINLKDSLDLTNRQLFVIEFFHSLVPEGLNYTALLESNPAESINLEGYSFAWYKDGQLTYKFGDFPYNTRSDFIVNHASGSLNNMSGYRNLAYSLSDDTYFIISRQEESIAERVLTFSFLFISLSISLLFYFLVTFNKSESKFHLTSFRVRLQFFYITAISLIILLLAIITFYYLQLSNMERFKEEMKEKTLSVVIELQHKLSGIQNESEFDNNSIEQLLKKFSLVFFSDINLYSTSGQLIASSRPQIFITNLQSKLINPSAYYNLKFKNQLYYITEEKIGNSTFYSSYMPLMVSNNQTVGFVNLPYFSRQSDLERSSFLMISSFINLFVILGIIGIFIAFILSKYLTKPLSVIQESLASVQIDKPNSKIFWNNNDEIGLLVKEYNQMIDKLEQSTILLKQSERESAWREVARQIAHEIKNPLTPMKLNVQYLEKVYNEKDPDFDKKMKIVSESLILQIDTLDKVAEMFSDFSKTKSRDFEKVNLFEIMNSCVILFNNNASVQFDIINPDQLQTYYTLAFKKDIMRVFTNLFKNAIQSLENRVNGKISIEFQTTPNHYIITIEDNGKGIPEESKNSIFQPYFTTKSGGTGLGLAIVKSIMNEIGGDINFKSTTDIGSKFILTFMRYDD